MSRFEELAGRVTERLKVDPELRMEVARELTDHLEDSAEAFRRGGDCEEDAEANAAGAFGDETEVAQGIWEANRKRVRWRAAAWWAARAALLPLAIVLMLAMMGRGLLVAAQLQALDQGILPISDTRGPGGWLIRREAQRIRNAMSEDERLIVFGDESADDPVQAQRAIWERCPDDPMYYGHYITHLLSVEGAKAHRGDRDEIDAILREVRHGRSVDADNALYDVLEASLLSICAAELVEDENLSYDSPERDGRIRSNAAQRISVKDRDALDEAMNAFLASAPKPHMRCYAIEMETRRQSMLPRPRTLCGHIQLIARSISVLLPNLSHFRRASMTAGAVALDAAEQGKRAEAEQLIDAIDGLAQKLAVDSRCAIDLFVAESIAQLGITYRMLAFTLLEDEAGRQALDHRRLARIERHHGLMRESRQYSKDELARAGLLMHITMPAIPGYDIDFGPWRSVEYATFDQGFLGIMLVLMNGLAALAATMSLWKTWRQRHRADRPVLLTVGWKQPLVIVASAVLLPAVLIGLWMLLVPAAGRAYGIHVTFDRMLLAYGVVIACTLMLFQHLAERAMRSRATAIGMPVPPRARHPLLAAAMLLALPAAVATIWHLVVWTPSQEKPGLTWVPHLLLISFTLVWLSVQIGRLRGVDGRKALERALLFAAVAATLCGIAGGIFLPSRQYAVTTVNCATAGLLLGATLGLARNLLARGSTRQFYWSAVRSTVPIIAVAAVLLTVIAAPVLWRIEADAVGRISDPKKIPFITEIENSDLRLMKQWIMDGE
ncbi:MAG: hypothetical protein CMJ18_17455 [Phycisphaeraceae bacterium]|nr:hypothetical protein [Phycisphaeraceae bacterium]